MKEQWHAGCWSSVSALGAQLELGVGGKALGKIVTHCERCYQTYMIVPVKDMFSSLTAS